MISTSKLNMKNDNPDLLFHYTNFYGGLSIILGHTLRMGFLSKMNDPLEFKSLDDVVTCIGNIDDEKLCDKFNELERANQKRIDCVRLLSFSVNDFHENDNVFEKPVVFGNYLNYGWGRTRMWAQYADNHRGLCLIFNREKLIEKLNQIHGCKLLYGKINYTNDFFAFEKAMIPRFDEKNIDDDYSNFYLTEDKEKFLFQKCDDFMAEQEYRIALISNNFQKNKPHIVDYGDSLEGVIASDHFDDANNETIKRLSDLFRFPVFKICWRYGTPDIFAGFNAE